jgi:hypothetical protein
VGVDRENFLLTRRYFLVKRLFLKAVQGPYSVPGHGGREGGGSWEGAHITETTKRVSGKKTSWRLVVNMWSGVSKVSVKNTSAIMTV